MTQTKANTKRRSAPKPRRGRELPDDACPTCGTIMRSARSKVFVSVNGDQMAVPDIPHLRCPKCGEGLFTLAAARERERRGIDLYRAKYGLLSADAIRAIREHHGLTQAELARILRLGGNTLSRWEAGRNVQSAAMDVLLRLIRDLPGRSRMRRNSTSIAADCTFRPASQRDRVLPPSRRIRANSACVSPWCSRIARISSAERRPYFARYKSIPRRSRSRAAARVNRPSPHFGHRRCGMCGTAI